MKIKVRVKYWLRGRPYDSSLLKGRKMCCLGFAALQCGFTKKEIRGVEMPGRIESDNSSAIEKAKFLFNGPSTYLNGKNTRFSIDAASINDDREINDNVRMTKLRALAKKYGHQFIFSKK